MVAERTGEARLFSEETPGGKVVEKRLEEHQPLSLSERSLLHFAVNYYKLLEVMI